MATIRLAPPQQEPPVPGETRYQQQQRVARNRRARDQWAMYAAEICLRCGMARINVVHEQDPAAAPEGPDYYASLLHELHPFEAA
jgi:hypothetical protein